MINENSGWLGIWKIKSKDIITGKIKQDEIKNRVMDTALNELMKVIEGLSTDLEIKYLAVGTDNTPVTDSDLILGNEIFRTGYISRERVNNETTTIFTILDNEAVDHIEEIGVFGGSSATIITDSGTLISRILWSRNKTSTEEIQFTRIDRMVRA
jgi:hypothetical protein